MDLNLINLLLTVFFGSAGISLAIHQWWIPGQLASNPYYRQRIADSLRSASGKKILLYKDSVKNFLDKVDSLFDSPFSPKSLGVAIVVALFYSTGIFVCVYAIGGLHSIGNTPVFPAELGPLKRVVFSLIFVIFSGMIIYVLFRSRNIHKWGKKIVGELFRKYFPSKHRQLLDCGSKEVEKWINRFVTGLCCLLAAAFIVIPGYFAYETPLSLFIILGIAVPFIATIVVGSDTPGIPVFLIGVGMVGTVATLERFFVESGFYLAIPLISLVAFFAAFLIATLSDQIEAAIGLTGSVGGFFVGYLASKGVFSGSTTIDPTVTTALLFLIFLPVVNGIADYISWGCTRRMATDLVRELKDLPTNSAASSEGRWSGKAAFVIVGHFVADLVIAFGCLLLVVTGAIFIVQKYNAAAVASDLEAPLPLLVLIEEVSENPTGVTGIWVIALLISTLVPTILHLVTIVVSPILAMYPRQDTRNKWIHELEKDIDINIDQVTIKDIALWKCLDFPVCIFSLTFTLIIIVTIISFIIPVGQLLVIVSETLINYFQ